jgi:hypothetical protein
MIPFLDLGAAYRDLKNEIDTAIHRVLDSAGTSRPRWEASRPNGKAFCEADHAVGLANRT